MRLFDYLLVFVFFICGLQKVAAQAYGLGFSSHEVIPEQRTSLDLTVSDPVCFSNSLDLSFDLSFKPNFTTYFGYVFRLINENGQNIDLIYDQKDSSFHIISEEAFTGIRFRIEPKALFGNWTRVYLRIDVTGQVTLRVNQQVHEKRLPLKGKCFKIIFGACSEHNFISRDIPPMKLRNISLDADGSSHYFWPLDQLGGNDFADSLHQKAARAVNPSWEKPLHLNWQMVRSLTVHGSPSVAFNEKDEVLYIVSADTLFSFHIKGGQFYAIPLSATHANLLAGNQSIVDQQTGKLYNFYIDQKALAVYDIGQKRWNRNFDHAPVTEYWHVNKFFSGNDLYILCGYGQLKYKNLIQKVDLRTGKWEAVTPKGDFLAPRYLAGVGVTPSGDTAYLAGGFGSREGDQLLNPKHFYDFFQYDVKRNTLTRLFTLPEPKEDFVFANSLVIDQAGQSYYALTLPKSQFNAQLQLIKGSLQNSSYRLLGKPFPYSFSDNKSFADLYYCKSANQLLAVTLYDTREVGTEVKVFTINFPPNEIIAVAPAITAKQKGWLKPVYIIVPVLLLLAGLFYWRGKRKAKPARTVLPVEHKTTEPVDTAIIHEAATSENATAQAPRNRIILFGSFEVTAADGQAITKQFTPLLKEMFLLILIDSLRYHKGVSAEKLNEVLWNDKDIKDAKNNRSVNLVKLKNILDKLGDCTISRQTGAWKFEYDPSHTYIDFDHYLGLVAPYTTDEMKKRGTGLMQVVNAGGFLQETHYEWLDPIKAEISNQAIGLLLSYSEQLLIPEEAEEVIAATDAVFRFDELNEQALKLKCRSLIALGRHTLAKNTYTGFVSKYKIIYDEEFSTPYNALFP